MIDEDDIVRSSLSTDLAMLTRQTATPVAPFGYGTDISCGLDIDEQLTLVDPMSPLSISQAIIRRWDTPRGVLPDDGLDASDYGEDLVGWLNTGITERDLRTKRSKLELEALKDDRINQIRVTLTTSGSLAGLTLHVDALVRPVNVDSAFRLVLAVTSASVVIESIGEEI